MRIRDVQECPYCGASKKYILRETRLSYNYKTRMMREEALRAWCIKCDRQIYDSGIKTRIDEVVEKELREFKKGDINANLP